MRRTTKILLVALSLFLFPLSGSAEYAPFAIVSDSHVGAPNSVYPSVIEAVDQQNIRIIIHTGDAIDRPGSVKQWTRFFAETGPGKKLHLAPGNHDIIDKKSLDVYLRFFPEKYYSFSEGDTLFVLLNTELPGEEAMIEGDQLTWLGSELQRPFRYKFVFLHEPLFPVVPLHGLDRHAEERDRLHRLFVDASVSLVVSGHDHSYRRTINNGITYVVAGGMGGFLPPFGRNGSPFRYIVATRTNGRYSFVVRDMEGSVRDEFIVVREPPIRR